MHHGIQLKECVDLHGLDTGPSEQFARIDLSEDKLGNAVRPRIAIVIRLTKQLAARIEQREIYSPGINSDGGRRILKARAIQHQAPLNLRPHSQDIPMQAARQVNAAIREAMQFVE